MKLSERMRNGEWFRVLHEVEQLEAELAKQKQISHDLAMGEAELVGKLNKLEADNQRLRDVKPSVLARMFHDEYERLAPRFGYKTREETRVFDMNTPNGELMCAVAKCILDALKEGAE